MVVKMQIWVYSEFSKEIDSLKFSYYNIFLSIILQNFILLKNYLNFNNLFLFFCKIYKLFPLLLWLIMVISFLKFKRINTDLLFKKFIFS